MLKHFTVGDFKLRLDRYLAGELPEISRSKIQKDILAGAVSVNGNLALEGKFVVRAGDTIDYNLTERPSIEAMPLELKILFENKDILIIDKPPGLVVHPAPGYKGNTLAAGLLARYKEINAVGEDEVRPGIVHRLDKDTSGVMLVAKTPQMFMHLKDAFAGRKIKKEYLALICGHLPIRHGFIDSPIGRHPGDFRKMHAAGINDSKREPKDAKDALTEYEVIKYFRPKHNAAEKNTNYSVDGYTLIRVKLHTGRTHQIRVHFSSLGFPLAGDTLYGKCEAPLLGRQFLHAQKIEVQLIDGSWVEVESSLPHDLEKVLARMEEI